MKLFVGITDYSWFSNLSQISPDEVNFWRPGGSGFSAIDIGAPFLFKLHFPINKIVGGGSFVRFEKLPLSLAWDAFKDKNGVSNIKDFKRLINSLRPKKEENPQIGCIILNSPFFLKENDWVDVPANWLKPTQVGKIYDTESIEGISLWNQIISKIPIYSNIENSLLLNEPLIKYGKEYLTKARLGQGAFRVLVTSAYSRRCAITGEKTLPVLEAAHILPFVENGPNQISNGILLRSDLHKLFDNGYITINNDYIVEVSRKIKEEFENGRDYYAYHGKSLVILPGNVDERPGYQYINWHNENVFNG